MYRELEEETGLTKDQVDIWGVTCWLRYHLLKIWLERLMEKMYWAKTKMVPSLFKG